MVGHFLSIHHNYLLILIELLFAGKKNLFGLESDIIRARIKNVTGLYKSVNEFK